MATFTQKNMSGALFRTKEKKNQNTPDYAGNCKVGDVDYRIAGWICVTKNDDKYLKISFTPQDEYAQAPKDKNDDDECGF